MPERFAYCIVKRRYINTLPFLSFFPPSQEGSFWGSVWPKGHPYELAWHKYDIPLEKVLLCGICTILYDFNYFVITIFNYDFLISFLFVWVYAVCCTIVHVRLICVLNKEIGLYIRHPLSTGRVQPLRLANTTHCTQHGRRCGLELLSLIHIWRCRRIERCRSRWSPYH